jgi:hypothetical protein
MTTMNDRRVTWLGKVAIWTLGAVVTLAGCRPQADEVSSQDMVATLPTIVPTQTPTPFERFLQVYSPKERDCLLQRVGQARLMELVEEASGLHTGVAPDKALRLWTMNHRDELTTIACADPSGDSWPVFEQGVFRFRTWMIAESPAPGGLGRVALPGTVSEAREVFRRMPEVVHGDVKQERTLPLATSDVAGGALVYGDSVAFFGDIALAAVPYRRHWTVAETAATGLRPDVYSKEESGRDGNMVWIVHLISGNQLQLFFGDMDGRMSFDFRANDRQDLDALIDAFVKVAALRSDVGDPTPIPTLNRPPPGPPTSTAAPARDNALGTPGP